LAEETEWGRDPEKCGHATIGTWDGQGTRSMEQGTGPVEGTKREPKHTSSHAYEYNNQNREKEGHTGVGQTQNAGPQTRPSGKRNNLK